MKVGPQYKACNRELLVLYGGFHTGNSNYETVSVIAVSVVRSCCTFQWEISKYFYRQILLVIINTS